MRGILKRLLLVALLVGVAGCETPVETQRFPEMTFAHLPPIQLLVSDIQIETTAKPGGENSIVHLFPVPPDQALRRWAEDRLKSTGAQGTARFTIVRAEAIGTPLTLDKGVTGLFKAELSDRYIAKIDAVLTIYDSNGQRRAHVEAQAEHATTIREDATLAGRRKVMYEVTEKLMADFNAEMERNIPRYLSEFVL